MMTHSGFSETELFILVLEYSLSLSKVKSISDLDIHYVVTDRLAPVNVALQHSTYLGTDKGRIKFEIQN